MKRKYSTLLKDIVIFGLGSIGSKLILFLMVPIYTNYLSTEEYGIAELVFTISQLLIPFVSVVIFDAIVRFGLMKDQKSENVFLCGMLVVLIGSIITICVTPIIGLYNSLYEWRWYICIYVIASMLGSVEMNYLKVIDKNKLFAIISILQTFVMASLNLIFLVYLDMGIKGYLTASLLASVFLAIIAVFAGGLIKDLRGATFSRSLLIKMVCFSAPLILNNVSWWVIQSSNKILVEMMIGVSALGIYTVATKIPSLINVITSIFSQAWGISSIKEFESTKEVDFYSNVFKMYQVFVFGMAIIIIAIIKPFMQIYVGEDFVGAWQYIPLLLVSAAFSAIAGFYGTLYSALKKSVNNMITTIVGAVVNLALNVLLIPIIGLWGAVIALLVTYVIIAFCRMLDVRKHLKIRIEFKNYFANIIIVCIQALLVSIGYNFVLVSIVSLVAFFISNRRLVYEMTILLVKRTFNHKKRRNIK